MESEEEVIHGAAEDAISEQPNVAVEDFDDEVREKEKIVGIQEQEEDQNFVSSAWAEVDEGVKQWEKNVLEQAEVEEGNDEEPEAIRHVEQALQQDDQVERERDSNEVGNNGEATEKEGQVSENAPEAIESGAQAIEEAEHSFEKAPEVIESDEHEDAPVSNEDVPVSHELPKQVQKNEEYATRIISDDVSVSKPNLLDLPPCPVLPPQKAYTSGPSKDTAKRQQQRLKEDAEYLRKLLEYKIKVSENDRLTQDYERSLQKQEIIKKLRAASQMQNSRNEQFKKEMARKIEAYESAKQASDKELEAEKAQVRQRIAEMDASRRLKESSRATMIKLLS